MTGDVAVPRRPWPETQAPSWRAGARASSAARIGAWPASLAITAFAAALYLSFVGYGFELSDEGTVLYQILRTFRGERPYLDFHTGYTPAVFYLNAELFRIFGVSVLPIRIVLALVNALAVLLIFRLSLRLAGVVESACAALTYAIFLPFFAGQFGSFNIPYPAWYAVCAWLATELASVKAVETGRRSWLVAAGALAGLTFSFKPNTGVMALGAVVIAQLLATAPLRGRLGALLEGFVLVCAFLAVPAVLGFELITEQFLLLGIPLMGLVAGALWVRTRIRRELPQEALRPLAEGLRDVAVLLLGFAAVSALWLAYFLPKLGLARLAREVLLLGAGVERIYLLYYPDLSAWSAAVVAVALGAWLLPRLIANGTLSRRALLALAAVLVAATLVALRIFGLAPEGIVLSIGMQLENASYFLIPLVLTGGVTLWLIRVAGRPAFDGDALPPPLGVVAVTLVYALLLFLQLYPRIDFMHVVISMPSALVVAAGALAYVQRFWLVELGGLDGEGDTGDLASAGAAAAGGGTGGASARDATASALRRDKLARWIKIGAYAPIALALAARAWPFVDARLRLGSDPGVRAVTRLPLAVMPVGLEEDRDHDLRELGAVAEFVARSTRPDDPIFVFPALAMVPFLTGRSTPVPHDYFFSGRPDHADEAAMVAEIERARPPLLVTLNDRLGYFSASPAYYFILRDYVQRNYVLVRRFGRFDVLARRDRVHEHPDWQQVVEAGEGLSEDFAGGEYRDRIGEAQALMRAGNAADLDGYGRNLSDVDRGVRAAAARTIEGVAEREPDGLAGVARVIAPDPRAKLLFVRTLGEYGEARQALPYLIEVYLESSGRLRWEAGRSINFILARRLSDRFDLEAPADGPLWGIEEVPGAALRADDLTAGIDEFVERQRIGPLAAVVAARGERRDLAPRFEHFEDDDETSWWKMIGAFELSRLGERERLRTMFETINEGTLGAQFVPSLVLDPELVDPDAAAELVADRLQHGTAEERETAAWMVPYLRPGAAGGVADRALDASRNDADPRVKHAVDWALDAIVRRREADSNGNSEPGQASPAT